MKYGFCLFISELYPGMSMPGFFFHGKIPPLTGSLLPLAGFC
jgi:hypothetical protein